MAFPVNDLTGAQNLVNLVLAIREAQGQRTALAIRSVKAAMKAVSLAI